MTALVVGGDGLIGRALSGELKRRGSRVSTTSRRSGETSKSVRRLDLGDSDSFTRLGSFSEAYICAAVTRMEECEKYPASTRRLNVANTVSLARSLIEAGSFVVYLSSNTVFDGETGFPEENSQINPTMEYGKQKSEAEHELLSMKPPPPSGVAVVRITKVISAEMPLVRTWLDAISTSGPCTAFSDLMLSPVSLGYAVNLLLEAGQRRLRGIYHCSGAADISYHELVKRLCSAAGKPAGLVTAEAVGARAVYRPKFSSLSMKATQRELGIAPQSLDSAVSDIWREYNTARQS